MKSLPDEPDKKRVSFKFQTTFSPPNTFIKKVIPTEKRKTEFYLSILFAQYLLFNNRQIDKIELNDNDENRGSDINSRIDGKDIGIQLTRLVPDDYMTRKKVAFDKSLFVASEISQRLKPDFPVNINIYPQYIDQVGIPSKNLKSNIALIEEIAENLKNDLSKLKSESETIFKSVNNNKAQEIAKSYTFNPIPKDQYSAFPGKDNVFVNFEFDLIHITDIELSAQIDKIYKNKNNGSSQILIIWADQHEILEQIKEVAQMINKKFQDSSFQEVFFMTFLDRIDLFRDTLKIIKVK